MSEQTIGQTGGQTIGQPPLPESPARRAAPGLGGLTRRLSLWAAQARLGRKLAVLLIIAAVLAGVVTFMVLSGTIGSTATPESALALLVVDLVLALGLGATVVWGLVRLWALRRAGAAGARLHIRLAALFALMAIVPTIIVAVLAAAFFNFQVQAWFNDRVRTAVNESVAVAEAYLQEHRQVIAADALAMANDVNRQWSRLLSDPDYADQLIQTQAAVRALSEAIVFQENGGVLARTGFSFSLEFERPPFWALERAAGGNVVLLTSESEDRVRALVGLGGAPRAYLYVGRFIDPQVLQHVDRSQQAASEYSRLEGRRSGLQLTLVTIFIVMSLMLMLAAVGIGLSFANGMARPISTLVVAAERVRAGDLDLRLDEQDSKDEFASLTRAFNRMIHQLAEQRGELVAANDQLDERRRFTETVLARVSAGVIGVDAEGIINLPNRSATALLGTDVRGLIGRPLQEAVPEMADLFTRARARPEALAEDQIKIERSGRAGTLLTRIAAERGADGAVHGFVVTFDDVTELLTAQRKAAWADVARRIAHEIKNPLTPIQLSAERLRRKYLGEIRSDPATFEQCTETIVRQVGDIGRMVDEFSSFARMPVPVMKAEDLTAVCRDAVFLQRQAHPDIHFTIEAPPNAIACRVDLQLIVQALTNLVQNAVDAITGRAAGNATLPAGEVAIRVGETAAGAVIEVEDNGKGLPSHDRERLTEPYVTTRQNGTGLGLAIVKKIMEDHGGALRLDDVAVGGTLVSLTLPRSTTDDAGAATEKPKVEVPHGE